MIPPRHAESMKSGEQAALAFEQLPLAAVRQSIKEDWEREADVSKRNALWHEINALNRLTARLWGAIQGAAAAVQAISAEKTIETGKVDPYENA